MGTNATTVNAAADFANNVVGLLISEGEAAAKAYITVQAPFLEAPVIGFFTNELIDLLGSAIKKNIAEITTAVVIDIQTGIETSSVNQTFKNLQSAKAKGDADAISEAQAAFIKAAASLAHSDGSSTNVSA